MNEEEMKQRIAELEHENADLLAKATKYATYGDVMRTVAMLPLSASQETTHFRDRVEVALTFHGLNVKSETGKALSRAFVDQVIPEREKLVRMYNLIFHQREGNGLANMKADCPCLICAGARTSQEILKNEEEIRTAAQQNPETEEKLRSIDFQAMKALEHRLTEEEKSGILEMQDNLVGLFQDLDIWTDPPGGLMAILADILGGGRQMSGRFGGLDIQVISFDGDEK